MLKKLQEKWDDILNFLKKEHEVSDVSFTTWLLPLKLYSYENDTLYLLVPEKEFLNYVKKKYARLLQISIEEVTGISCEVAFIAEDDVTRKEPEPESSLIGKSNQDVSLEAIQNANLNPRYTFDTFVVGANNNLAHAASLAVAESPGEIYNPLFIYGGVGLGKTHLMHSIAHFILKNNPKAKILYVTSEKFTNELIDAIRNKNNISTTEFREKYRNNDVLLIDDIQFIIGKESTQEEFFHTFNTLHESGKQIVLTSDRPPKEILTLEDRLQSRFEWGLLADIQPPDFETRMALVNAKTEMLGAELPPNVVEYIASSITNNVRQLEGAVKKIFAKHSLMGRAIDMTLAEECIRDIFKASPGLKPTPELILEETANFYNITTERILGSAKTKDVVVPRQVAMYLIREMTDLSFPEIGRFMGRDHTTVLHAINKTQVQIEKDESFSAALSDLKKNIQNR